MRRRAIKTIRVGMLLALGTDAAGMARAQTPPSGHVATSAVGQVGQRQVTAEANPMGRVDSRIPSRLRNRIDRDYDPQTNTTTPFRIAVDRAAASPRRSR
jgi:hypothetical protein